MVTLIRFLNSNPVLLTSKQSTGQQARLAKGTAPLLQQGGPGNSHKKPGLGFRVDTQNKAHDHRIARMFECKGSEI